MLSRLIAMIFMFFCCQSGAEELVVVVNKANPVTTLQKSQIIDIYMGKFVAFPNGASAFPVDFESDMSLRTAFFETLLEQPVSRVNAYWSRLRFAGKVRPPAKERTVQGVLAYIRDNPGGVGYLPANAVTPDVKVVYRLE
ncbi:hypothetical protein TK45_15820 [Bowmanella sp. JS7-9]|nr:hypothetical protein TK45_15820 [Bowmanella sp. JS7-9]